MLRVHGLGDMVPPRFSAPKVWAQCGPSQASLFFFFAPSPILSFPAPHSVCPVPPAIALHRGVRGTEGVPALGPSGGSRLVLRPRERLFICQGLLLHGRMGRPQAPPALPRGWTCGSGPRESGPGSEAPLPLPGWLPRREYPSLCSALQLRCCGVLCRGPRGGLGKRLQCLFFAGVGGI